MTGFRYREPKGTDWYREPKGNHSESFGTGNHLSHSGIIRYREPKPREPKPRFQMMVADHVPASVQGDTLTRLPSLTQS